MKLSLERKVPSSYSQGALLASAVEVHQLRNSGGSIPNWWKSKSFVNNYYNLNESTQQQQQPTTSHTTHHNYDTYHIQNNNGTSKQRLDHAFQAGEVRV
jgi:hypothetical protein